MSPIPYEARSIIHLNIADFAVAVERLVDTRLKNRPVLVAAAGSSRAAVYDMSDEAYCDGVRKGMPLSRALKMCRGARVVDPHPYHYERAMSAVFDHVRSYSPLIESGEGNGHVFLDISGTRRLFGPPVDVAWRIRKIIRHDLNLDPIWSLAPNKLVAKVASRLVKPDGELIVEAETEERFLHPLHVHLLPGLEKDDLLVLRDFHIAKVGQIQLWTPSQLQVVFGRRGLSLYRLFRGIDTSPVLSVHEKPVESAQDHVFPQDTNDKTVLEGVLYGLVEKSGMELRDNGRVARRLAVTLDYSDGVRVARRCRIAPETSNDFKLFKMALRALALAWNRRIRVRRLRLVIDKLAYPSNQLELFPGLYGSQEDRSEPSSGRDLLVAMDAIRNRFGRHIIQTGRTKALAA